MLETILTIVGLIIGLLALAIVVLLVIAATKPDAFRIQRSAIINSAPDKVFPLIAGNADGGTEPATTYRFADGEPGAIGVIASVTEPFCEACNRLRLTADGQLRSCLFAMYETDLRTPLRLVPVRRHGHHAA